MLIDDCTERAKTADDQGREFLQSVIESLEAVIFYVASTLSAQDTMQRVVSQVGCSFLLS